MCGEASANGPQLLPSPIPARVGRYEIVDRLGAGGMGVVYLATDPLLRRTVAIKVLPAHDDDSLRERFAREARSAAALRHNHVVTIYDIGDDDGKPFITMEFLDGESMAEMVRRRAPLSIDRRLQLMLELCAGLGYAHRNGIVHRDIKPGNLMVTGEGSLKILDFGLARITSEASSAGLTQVGSMLGTPHYMSPEQVEGKVADERSDIFSVGVVFYELLTYQKAYPGDTAHVVLHNIVHVAPTPIRDLMPGIDPALEAVVNKGLEKDPAARYQNLASLAADLARVRSSLTAGAELETIIEPPLERRSRKRSKSSNTADSTPGRGTTTSGQPRRDRTTAVGASGSAPGRSRRALRRRTASRDHRGVRERAAARCRERGRVAAAGSGADRTRRPPGAGVSRRGSGVPVIGRSQQGGSPDRTIAEAAVRFGRGAGTRTPGQGATQGARACRGAGAIDQAAVERARRNFDEGAYEAAVRAASEALAYDESNHDALGIKAAAAAAIEERRRQQEHDAKARDIVERARQILTKDAAAAAALLEGFSPQHPLVEGALGDARARLAEIERQRREEEERQRQLALELEKRHKRARAYKASAQDALKTGRFADALASVTAARSELPEDDTLDTLETNPLGAGGR